MDEVKQILRDQSLINENRLDFEVEWYYGYADDRDFMLS